MRCAHTRPLSLLDARHARPRQTLDSHRAAAASLHSHSACVPWRLRHLSAPRAILARACRARSLNVTAPSPPCPVPTAHTTRTPATAHTTRRPLSSCVCVCARASSSPPVHPPRSRFGAQRPLVTTSSSANWRRSRASFERRESLSHFTNRCPLSHFMNRFPPICQTPLPLNRSPEVYFCLTG